MKTLANLFLHQWVRTAWCKKKNSPLPYPFLYRKTHPHFPSSLFHSHHPSCLSQSEPSPSFIHSKVKNLSPSKLSFSLSLEPLSLSIDVNLSLWCEPLSIKTPLQNLSMFLESPIASHFSLFFPYHNLCHTLNLSLSPPLSVLRILVAQFIVWILTRNPLRNVSESQYPSLYFEFLGFWFRVFNLCVPSNLICCQFVILGFRVALNLICCPTFLIMIYLVMFYKM